MNTINLAEIQARFETAYPQEILKWAVTTYEPNRLAVVTSFGPTGIVTLHMLSEIQPGIPVLTLDTELLFPETYELMDEIEARLNLNLKRIKPQLTPAQQGYHFGEGLWSRSPTMCCHLRKVLPLAEALAPYDAWFTGLRRDQSRRRANIPVVSYEPSSSRLKIAPLAAWTSEMVWTYIHAHDLPYNRLHDQGYPSIGCWPCTQPMQQTTEERDGRWSNTEKSECGIHLEPL